MSNAIHFTPVIDRRRTFEVVEDEHGLWIVHELHGLTEGVFRTKRDALRFALFEAGNPDSVVVIPGGKAARRSDNG